MHINDFDYDLPEGLIAQYPTQQRTASRLMTLCGVTGQVTHRQFSDILDLINPNDVLVFNDTKVIPARLFGEKATGGQVEIFIERVVNDTQALALLRASKSPKPGTRLYLKDQTPLEVLGRRDDQFLLAAPPHTPFSALLATLGEVPLPPYIDRRPEDFDLERYQTVYAKREGAVAAPTAGLHFDEPLLQALKDRGVTLAFVTLHVGAGTFAPVRVDNIAHHTMHKEVVEVTEEAVDRILTAKSQGGRVVAVGTTTLRSLEAASQGGSLQPFTGETDLFITPGYDFKAVDAMVTNFHLPKSTLLMLVSAFAGKQHILQAYGEAVRQHYRFFSYGDAMFLIRQ